MPLRSFCKHTLISQVEVADELWRHLRLTRSLTCCCYCTDCVLSAGERSRFWSLSSQHIWGETPSQAPHTVTLQEIPAGAVASLGKHTTSIRGGSWQRLTLHTLVAYHRVGLDWLSRLHCLTTEPEGKRAGRCPGIWNKGPSSGRARSTEKR